MSGGDLPEPVEDIARRLIQAAWCGWPMTWLQRDEVIAALRADPVARAGEVAESSALAQAVEVLHLAMARLHNAIPAALREGVITAALTTLDGAVADVTAAAADIEEEDEGYCADGDDEAGDCDALIALVERWPADQLAPVAAIEWHREVAHAAEGFIA